MKRFLLLYGFSCFIFTSCKKHTETITPEEPVTTPPTTYPNYSAAKIGTYWIYERFEVNTDGTYTSLHQFDSCYVEKDTTVGNYTYSKIHKYDFQYNSDVFFLQRDSLHYIVGQFGISFSSEDFTTILFKGYSVNYSTAGVGDTIAKLSMKMEDKDVKITTPAGTFTTCDARITVATRPAYIQSGVNNPRYMHKRYAKNVGVISETDYFFNDSNYTTERRLIRYHIN